MKNSKKKNNKKVLERIKLRHLFIVLFFFISTLLGVVYYYGLDPALLTKLSFYANLANPNIYIVRVPEGLRKEEIAEIMADRLSWDESEKDDFVNSPKDTSDHWFDIFEKTLVKEILANLFGPTAVVR